MTTLGVGFYQNESRSNYKTLPNLYVQFFSEPTEASEPLLLQTAQ
jgi:hypothetical protein